MSALPHLVSFWTGKFTWLEHVCLASMIEMGHKVTIYSYEPDKLRNIAPCEVRDAREVYPLTDDLAHLFRVKAPLAANIWRYQMLERGLGVWVDLDLFLIRPLRVPELFFAYESPDYINNAVLSIPPSHKLLQDLTRFSLRRPIVPFWWPKAKQIKQHALSWIGQDKKPEDFAWGILGPQLLTKAVKYNGLQAAVASSATVYAVPFDNCPELISPSADPTRHFTDQTMGVHLWASYLRKLLNGQMPSADSWLGQMVNHRSAIAA